MELSKELTSAMSAHEIFSIPPGGFNIPVTDTVIVMWIIMAFLIISAYVLTRQMKSIPKGKQNFVETVVELINNLTKDAMGHHWKHFAPYIGTILLFLIFANIISIFNIIPNGEQLYKMTGLEFFEHIPDFGIRPPTKDINVTACMAIMSIALVVISGIRFKKFSGFLKSFVEPMPLMLPMKILEYFIRPLSLALRLFGNIMGAFIVMELLYAAMPAVFPAGFSIYFDLFDGALQAYVFVFLTSLYIAEAIE
jgi:F-type H+-transporting ATPase subunit a